MKQGGRARNGLARHAESRGGSGDTGDNCSAAAQPAVAADYAPLDCGKAGTAAQHAICASYDLGQLEARMATLFEWTSSLVAWDSEARCRMSNVRSCRRERRALGSKSCIRGAYQTRIGQLEAGHAQIAKQGPF